MSLSAPPTAEEIERLRFLLQHFDASALSSPPAPPGITPSVASASEPPSLATFRPPRFPPPPPPVAAVSPSLPRGSLPPPSPPPVSGGWNSLGHSFTPSSSVSANTPPFRRITQFPSALTPDVDDDDDDGSIASGMSRMGHSAIQSRSVVSSHRSSACQFLTDEDLSSPDSPFRRDLSPLRIGEGSMEIQGSHSGFSSHAIRFEFNPDFANQVTFGLDIQSQMQLDLEDDPAVHSSHRHRFVILCTIDDKIVGLDLCPSHTKSINILPHLGTGLEVPLSEQRTLSLGDVANVKRGSRGGKVQHPRIANHIIGADMGFGDGTSPGGHECCLFLTCLGTEATFVCGLRDLKGETICDAFWTFAIDAGGFPKRLRCDFDKRFAHGAVGRLLRSQGVRIGASPPHRQSQSGGVERQWQTACNMARSLLTIAKLPKRHWFWAVREAVTRMSIPPVKSGDPEDLGEFIECPALNAPESGEVQANKVSSHDIFESLKSDDAADENSNDFGARGNLASATSNSPAPPRRRKRSRKLSSRERHSAKADSLSTPHELFHGVPPDCQILFPFGCLGHCRKPFLATGQQVSHFHMRSHVGIALGRSDCSNALMFWDPQTSKFSVSADHELDIDRTPPNAFPESVHDGSFLSHRISGADPPKEPFPPGSRVCALMQDEFHSGTVVSVPTSESDWHSIQPDDPESEVFDADPVSVSGPDDPLFPVDRCRTESEHVLPSWIKNNGKVALDVDGDLRPGSLMISEDMLWNFVQRDKRGEIIH